MEESNVVTEMPINDKNGSDKPDKKILIIAVVALVVVLVAGILAFVFCGKDKPEESVTEFSTEEEITVNDAAEKSEEPLVNETNLFSNGLLAVCKNGKWGYINKEGNIVIDCQFDSAGEFSDDGFAAVTVGSNAGLINKSGKFTVNPQFEYISAEFNDGCTVVCKNGKYGFADMSGKVVIGCNYEQVTDFRNGYAVVVFESAYGIIDKKGNYVVNPQYEYLCPAFSEKSGKNIYIAQKDTEFGYIDVTDKTVIGFQYDALLWDEGYAQFLSDKFAVVGVNNKFGLIDTDGNYLINTIYDGLYYCGNGIFSFIDYDTYKYGLVSCDGTELAPAQFDAAGKADCGLVAVKSGNYYGFVDYSGRYVVNPVYDYAAGFKNGYSVVSKDGKYSFVNKKCELVVNYQFDYMTDFNTKGYAIVRLGDKYGIINAKGEYVVNCQYCYAKTPDDALVAEALTDDFFCVIGEDKKLRIITAAGKTIASGYEGVAGELIGLCDYNGCYNITNDGSDLGYCQEHIPVNQKLSFHEINYNYYTEYSAYLKNPTGKTTVYTSCGEVAYGHWISGYDPVTIHEVYTDGCCLVSYVTDSGIVRTYYAKISDFTTHRINWWYGTNFTAYLRNPSGKTTLYTSCGVVTNNHWISGYDPVTIHEVYTDGCCRVSYVTDSGVTRTYYASIYDFVF